MALERINIPFPLGGLSEDYAFSSQPPGTTREALNVRGQDPKTGRTRGAQRPGHTLYLSAAAVTNENIKEIGSVASADSLLTYAENNGGTVTAARAEFRLDSPNGENMRDMFIDEFENIYMLQERHSWVKYNPDGGIINEITVPMEDAPATINLRAITVDKFQNVFVCTGQGSTTTDQNEARIYAFEYLLDDTYRFAWQYKPKDSPGGAGSDGMYIEDLAFFQDNLITLELNRATAITAYIRMYKGITLADPPSGTPDLDWQLFDGSTNISYGRRLAVRDDGIVYVAALGVENAPDKKSYTIKYNLFGELAEANSPAPATSITPVWIVNTSASQTKGGMGFGVAIGPTADGGDPSIYTCGVEGPNSDAKVARRIIDLGVTATSDDTGDSWSAAEVGGNEIIDDTNADCALRMATDEDFTLYVPFASGGTATVRIFKSDGTAQADPVDGSGGMAFCCGVPIKKPNYGSASIDVAETVYYGIIRGSSVAFMKTRLLDITQSATGSLRSFKYVACIADGDIQTFTTSAWADPASGSGAGTLDTLARYVQGVQFFDRFYITDGLNYKYYDATDNLVADWTSTKSNGGSIPKRCRLVEVIFGRVILARDPDDAFNWHMSARDDAGDWNNFPQTLTSGQAISGNNANSGKCPDIINSIVPISDDLALFGGDHTIWRLTGDPLYGGQFDLVTDGTGMSFGRPWCKDLERNILYFFGSRGGLYAYTGGQIQRLSRDTIERRLQGIDFSTFYIRLAYDYEQEGVHIYQCPFGDGGATAAAWFWDKKADRIIPGGAFWEDSWGATSIQPTSVFVIDGDSQSDRKVLLGCEDSKIMYVDPTNDDDRGTNIASLVTIGPIAPAGAANEYAYQDFEAVLAPDMDGCYYEWYVDDEPDVIPGAAVVSGFLDPGRNATRLIRFTGDVAYLKLRNAGDQRWAFEKASIMAASAGVTQKR